MLMLGLKRLKGVKKGRDQLHVGVRQERVNFNVKKKTYTAVNFLSDGRLLGPALCGRLREMSLF